MTEFPEYSHSIKRTLFGSFRWEVYHCGTLVLRGKADTERRAFDKVHCVIREDKDLSRVSMRRI